MAILSFPKLGRSMSVAAHYNMALLPYGTASTNPYTSAYIERASAIDFDLR